MRLWPLICLLSILNDSSDATWFSLKSQYLKTVKHLKTMLEVINLRTQEHLPIAKTCGMPRQSKPQRDQGQSRCNCWTFWIATGPAQRYSGDSWKTQTTNHHKGGQPTSGWKRHQSLQRDMSWCWSQGHSASTGWARTLTSSIRFWGNFVMFSNA